MIYDGHPWSYMIYDIWYMMIYVLCFIICLWYDMICLILIYDDHDDISHDDDIYCWTYLIFMRMLMLDLWLQAETPGVSHFGAYHRPSDGYVFLSSFWDPVCWFPDIVIDIHISSRTSRRLKERSKLWFCHWLLPLLDHAVPCFSYHCWSQEKKTHLCLAEDPHLI